MSRRVLSVATGPYVPLQKRLLGSLKDVDVLSWTDAWPPGSPSHAEAPYAFKLHAMAEARRRGATSVLWLDAPVVAAGSPGPVFERIEKEGHVFVTSGDKLGNWIGDAALAAFGLSRDEAMTMPLLNGTFIGLDFRRAAWLDAMLDAAAKGLLQGPYFTGQAPAEIRARKPGKSIGPASRDPRCWGHRHDEAIGSLLAHRMGMSIAPAPDLFGPQGLLRTSLERAPLTPATLKEGRPYRVLQPFHGFEAGEQIRFTGTSENEREEWTTYHFQGKTRVASLCDGLTADIPILDALRDFLA